MGNVNSLETMGYIAELIVLLQSDTLYMPILSYRLQHIIHQVLFEVKFCNFIWGEA